VIGGLAGAAWLLTGAAAHAADRADEPTGSLLGSGLTGDVTTPVSGLLTAAVRPLEARPAHHHRHHVVADILEVPQRVLTRPVDTVRKIADDTTGTTVDSATGGVDLVLREVSGPLRHTGEPAAAPHRLTTVTPVTPDAYPAAERPQRPAATPVTTASPRATVASASHARILKAVWAQITGLKTGSPARHIKVASTAFAHRHPVMHRAVAGTATALEGSAGGDGPAPLQVHLGDVSGTPTSWSGTPTEGGSAAFLPAAIASSTMACQRLPIASDVEVRRFDAEAPTVSPD
jgi:hypothetical protein